MQRTWSGNLAALSAAAAIALMPLAIPAAAQEAAPADPPAAMQPDENDLRAFANASIGVEALYDIWEPRIARAGDEREAEQMRQQAAAEMEAFVEEQGLTPEEYNNIYRLAMADPDLAVRIETLRRQIQ
ncbi:MAG: DUF4168 domain-containing protein [Alphaproteobacteria bacterium]